MDILEELSRAHSKTQADRVVEYVGDDPDRFAELIALMMGRVYRITQRAAWPVSICVKLHPELIVPYFGKLIGQLERDDAHVAVRRNILRLLQFVEIPKRYHGRIFDVCYKLFADTNEAIAVRVFAMTVAANIANGDEDLISELRLVARQHPEKATSAFRSRSRRVLGV